MRLPSITRFSLLTIAVISFFSCTKTTEQYQTASLNDYYPLAAGKYITYRLDSTVFTNFGLNTEIHSWQVKHVIDSKITDNLGRPSYRVFRYLRDTAGTQPWVQNGAYFITPLTDQVEVIEDNLRFIKIHTPIKEGFTWKGNAYLNDEPYSSLYSFTNDNDMNLWDYHYTTIHDVFLYKQQSLTDVVNIVQQDERFTLDTSVVVNNTATIAKNSGATYLKGTATDTIVINASIPDLGHENLIIYNQTNAYASLNKINIPPGLALNYQYANNKWYYPNPLQVVNSKVSIPHGAFIAYIFGTATTPPDSIKIDTGNVDTFQTRKLTICNRANVNAYLNKIAIPPGLGRIYELQNGQWTYYNNTNTTFDKDPYITELPFGSTTYSIEKYANGIGLVYKEMIMWDYQPSSASKTGFGIKLTMIDHN